MYGPDVLVEHLWAVQRGRICPDVYEVEQSERNDARQLVQLSKQKSVGKFDPHSMIAVR